MPLAIGVEPSHNTIYNDADEMKQASVLLALELKGPYQASQMWKTAMQERNSLPGIPPNLQLRQLP